MKSVGPVAVRGEAAEGEFRLPLATYESPLWPSVNRGAKITRLCGGLTVTVTDERMTRSIALEADDAAGAARGAEAIRDRREDLARAVESTSRFARLKELTIHPIGNVLFVRLAIDSGDAAGHNMATQAADAVMADLLAHIDGLRYVSISGNVCTDKKNSAVNGLLGRGRYAIADLTIPREVCEKQLRTTAAKMADLNVKKNLLGSLAAGSVRSANAHYANMLLAFYLATGQDAANIVEGSQGFTHVENRDGDLYFSVTLPNLIVGTVGNGKDLAFVRENLDALGCTVSDAKPGENARRLAALAAAAVWCGELSLMAAQTNPGELMKTHLTMERRGS